MGSMKQHEGRNRGSELTIDTPLNGGLDARSVGWPGGLFGPSLLLVWLHIHVAG